MLFECIVRPLQIESERAVALNACHPDECGSNKKPSKWCQIVVVSTLAYGLVPDHWAMPELLWLIPDDLAMSYMFYYWSLHMCDIWTYHVLVSKWKSLQRLTMRGCLRHWLSLLTVLSERSVRSLSVFLWLAVGQCFDFLQYFDTVRWVRWQEWHLACEKPVPVIPSCFFWNVDKGN